MLIQINSDHHISENEQMVASFKSLIADALKYHSGNISRIEVHLSDENGEKGGINDKCCLLEARVEGKQPIAVTCQANSIDEALKNSLVKMDVSLKKVFEKMKSHH